MLFSLLSNVYASKLWPGERNLCQQEVKKSLSNLSPKLFPHIVFKLPVSICDENTKQIRQFWWGVEKGARKVHWVAREKMIKSKSQGGLGFRDTRLFNQASLARQAWRLLQFPDCLCHYVRVF